MKQLRKMVRVNCYPIIMISSTDELLSPSQKPLCFVRKLWRREKDSARGTMGRGKAFIFHRALTTFFLFLPSGSLCGRVRMNCLFL